MTGEIKKMLRKKNVLMRKGKTEEAGAMATKIGNLIAKQNSKALLKLKSGDTKSLWSQVNKIICKNVPSRGDQNNSALTAKELNDHYAIISTDEHYCAPRLKEVLKPNEVMEVSEYKVFRILDTLKNTSSGPDEIPFWFFRLACSVVPTQWKRAIITPIGKITNPSKPLDYRPISVTSILSRELERHVVSTYIYPALLDPPPDLDFTNQYAFRPSGSCTAALIAILDDISDLLKTSDYVILIALDFSRAFDSIKHQTLFEKYSKLKIQSQVYNWLVSFFQDREHSTKFGGVVSESRDINSSVVQGSDIGPASYVVAAADLKSKSEIIKMHKFADDTSLITAGENYGQLKDELDNVEAWAKVNNLQLNKAKSYEIIFSKRRCKPKNPPPEPSLGIKRVNSLKLLGITLQCNLSMEEHVNNVLTGCASNLYALNMLRAHGLQGVELAEIYRAKILSKIMYGSPAWWGYCSADTCNRIDSFLKKGKKFGFYGNDADLFEPLCRAADDKLFDKILKNPDHILHRFLPETKTTKYCLRPRKHGFILPTKDDRNFFNRILFKDIF